MNPDGYLVRWTLVSVQDVYELSDNEINPRGTEVYSRLRRVQMRPAYRLETGTSAVDGLKNRRAQPAPSH